jgi:hypothetical protein
MNSTQIEAVAPACDSATITALREEGEACLQN